MSKVRTTTVDLFTPDEHAILAEWFKLKPPATAQNIVVDEAIGRLGFDKEPGLYRRIDAAVAFIVLERAEKRLPQWSAIRDDKLILARKHRDASKIPNRKVVLQPRPLFCINWADSGPGFSWPVEYYVTWLPYYDRHVVTASADSPDAFGYCDFALGAFGIDTPIKEGARKIICGDWSDQNTQGGQQRWVCLFSTDLISKQEAEAWAEQVWPSERGKEDEDEFYSRVGRGPITVARSPTRERQVLPFRKQSQQKPDSEELKEREQRKLDPKRQALVRQIVEGHPETKWDSEALQRLHDDLEAWGE